MRRGRSAPRAAVIALLLAGVGAAALPSRPASAATTTKLQVFAAASLSDAFAEIGRRLAQQRPRLEVRFNFAGSQQLVAQIEQGAAADVFASADERWMSMLREHGLVAAEPKVFARNRLVVIVPKTNPARIGRLTDLARGGVKLVLGADAVPVGRYSRIALQNLARDPAFGADYATRVSRNVVSEEENVKSVVAKVQLGEADAGMVYRSDVTPSAARFVNVIEIPEAANVIASYPIAALDAARTAGHDAEARIFVDYVLSPEGQKILEKSGLMAATSAGR